MTENTYLIIGLSDPGREYKDTRHNIGFMLIDQVAVRLNARGMKLQAKAIVTSALYGKTEDHSCQAADLYKSLRSIGAGAFALL